MKYAALALVALLTGCGSKPPEVQACFRQIEHELVDPKTATIEAFEVEGKARDKVKLELRAANRMGGFGRLYVTCGPDGRPQTFTAEERGRWLLS